MDFINQHWSELDDDERELFGAYMDMDEDFEESLVEDFGEMWFPEATGVYDCELQDDLLRMFEIMKRF